MKINKFERNPWFRPLIWWLQLNFIQCQNLHKHFRWNLRMRSSLIMVANRMSPTLNKGVSGKCAKYKENVVPFVNTANNGHFGKFEIWVEETSTFSTLLGCVRKYIQNCSKLGLTTVNRLIIKYWTQSATTILLLLVYVPSLRKSKCFTWETVRFIKCLTKKSLMQARGAREACTT